MRASGFGVQSSGFRVLVLVPVLVLVLVLAFRVLAEYRSPHHERGRDLRELHYGREPDERDDAAAALNERPRERELDDEPRSLDAEHRRQPARPRAEQRAEAAVRRAGNTEERRDAQRGRGFGVRRQRARADREREAKRNGDQQAQ